MRNQRANLQARNGTTSKDTLQYAANTALEVFGVRAQIMASSSSPSPSRTRAAAHASEQDPCEAVAKLAELILAAEHCVFVTGAGISTNAGIRDYLS